MLETLKPTPPDKIIELLDLFRADPRTDKLDLGVGVYKDAAGPHAGHARGQGGRARGCSKEQDSKAYVGILGDLDFVARHGRARPRRRGAAPTGSPGAQTPGGTGAIRQLCELDPARRTPRRPSGMSDPTWPNHPAILGYLGIPSADLPLLRRGDPRASTSPG